MRKTSGNKRDRRGVAAAQFDYPSLVHGGKDTHVLVPVDDFKELVKAKLALQAFGSRATGREKLVEADDAFRRLAGERIRNARQAAGLSQRELGERLGIPQSQLSRIEKDPDRSQLRTLKRIAAELRVDVRALI